MTIIIIRNITSDKVYKPPSFKLVQLLTISFAHYTLLLTVDRHDFNLSTEKIRTRIAPWVSNCCRWRYKSRIYEIDESTAFAVGFVDCSEKPSGIQTNGSNKLTPVQKSVRIRVRRGKVDLTILFFLYTPQYNCRFSGKIFNQIVCTRYYE